MGQVGYISHPSAHFSTGNDSIDDNGKSENGEQSHQMLLASRKTQTSPSYSITKRHTTCVPIILTVDVGGHATEFSVIQSLRT